MQEQLNIDYDANAPYLASVTSRIGASILEFYGAHRGCEFHADELRRHVERAVGPCAPGSADRVMRHLRQAGSISYEVLSRRASLYKFGG